MRLNLTNMQRYISMVQTIENESDALLTHLTLDKMAAISQTTFSNAFSWMKMLEFLLKFHWNLFPRAQLTIIQHWLRQWLGTCLAPSHYLHQWWASSLAHICGTRGRRVDAGHCGFPSQRVSNTKHWCFLFTLAKTSCWTNRHVVSHLRCHDAYVMSL